MGLEVTNRDGSIHEDTMEAEIISLAHSCRELLPILDMAMESSDAVGLPIQETTMNVSIHEDNAGFEFLPDFYLFYVVKTHWFRE